MSLLPSSAGGVLLPALVAVAALAGGPTSTGPIQAGAEPDWPGWRGPGAGARAGSAAPLRWGAGENIRWKRRIEGRGHSSPIVVGDLVFLTAASSGEAVPGAGAVVHFMGGEEFLHPDSLGADRRLEVRLLALDRGSGEVRWQRAVRSGVLPFDNRHRVGSYANPTPVSDGERVIVWFGSQGLHAFALGGEALWSREFGGVGTMGMGVATSPVLVPDLGLVILQNDVEAGEGSFLAGIETVTGAVRWRVPRSQPAGWATPLAVRGADGSSLIVAVGAREIVAYGAADGAERWRVAGLTGNAVPSPVASGDGLVFCATGYPRKRVMALDAGDGSLVWSYGKGQGYVPSPVFHRGVLYLVSDGGILTALEGASGEVVYEGGRAPLPSRFFSSPVVAGERLYLTSEDGDTHIIRAGPRFSVLATNSLDEPVMASPAIVDGAIYLRGAEHLYAIAEPAPPASVEKPPPEKQPMEKQP